MELTSKRFVLMILGVFFVSSLMISGAFIFVINDLHNLNDNVDYYLSQLVLVDKKVNQAINSHNAEVDSWYMGNAKISSTLEGFFEAMRSSLDNGAEDSMVFDACLKTLDTYMIFEPHVVLGGQDYPYVDGYLVRLFDSNSFDPLGTMIFTDEYASYSIDSCGSLFFNKTSNNLSFVNKGGDLV